MCSRSHLWSVVSLLILYVLNCVEYLCESVGIFCVALSPCVARDSVGIFFVFVRFVRFCVWYDCFSFVPFTFFITVSIVISFSSECVCVCARARLPNNIIVRVRSPLSVYNIIYSVNLLQIFSVFHTY